MTIGPSRIIALILLALFGSACSKEPEEQAPVARSPLQQEELLGEALLNERCRSCHLVQEKGGTVGPVLSGVGGRRDRIFLEQVIREPARVHPGTVMPAYDTFSKKQVDSLVEYLGTLK